MDSSVKMAITVILAVAIYVGAMSFMAVLSGWRKLLLTYRSNKTITGGATQSFVVGRFNTVKYNGTLFLRATEEGLTISMFPVLRLGHPAILIPWNDLVVPDAPVQGLGWLVLSSPIHASGAPSVEMRFTTGVTDWIISQKRQFLPELEKTV